MASNLTDDGLLIVVLGMHQSGASCISRILEQLGLETSKTSLPSTTDERAHKEIDVQSLDKFNDQFFKELGQSWHNTELIPKKAFQGNLANQYRLLINQFLAPYAGQTLILNDPRLCRLLPLWQPVLNNLFARVKIISIVRHPLAVADTLTKRTTSSEGAPAIIECPYHSLSLWLTYNLELTNFTLDQDRLTFNYESLVAAPNIYRDEIAEFLDIGGSVVDIQLADDSEHIRANISQCIEQSNLPQQTLDYFEKLYALFSHDQLLESDIKLLSDLQSQDIFSTNDLISGRDRKLSALSLRKAELKELISHSHGRVNRKYWSLTQKIPKLDVLFVSQNAATRGHIYRVKHICDALNQINVNAAWIELNDLEKISSLPIKIKCLVISRCEQTPELEKFIGKRHRQSTRIIYDIDDFVFDTSVLDHDEYHFLSDLTVNDKNQWYQRFQSYRQVMETADAICVPTETLQTFSQDTCPSAIVFPNTFDTTNKRIADLARSLNATRMGSNVVLGYASGTPTHEQDFLTIQPVIIKLLKMYPGLELKIVGYLNCIKDRVFEPYRDRIRMTPVVPHTALAFEMVDFDINLIPLERNRFTDAKSELKFFETALLKTPSVAVDNPVYNKIIEQGQNGYLAATEQDWLGALSILIEDADQRLHVGEAAYKTAMANYAVEDLAQQYKTEVLGL